RELDDEVAVREEAAVVGSACRLFERRLLGCGRRGVDVARAEQGGRRQQQNQSNQVSHGQPHCGAPGATRTPVKRSISSAISCAATLASSRSLLASSSSAWTTRHSE